MTAQTLILKFPPSLNHYWRMVQIKGQPRMLISQEGRLYKRAVAFDARSANLQKILGPIAIEIDIYRPKKSGDLDNYFKVLIDGLKGIAWEDDSQIIRITARRFDDKRNPRAEVRIEAAIEEDELFARQEAALTRLV
jgi:crossover junction endodeoxyribonuclease RusA